MIKHVKVYELCDIKHLFENMSHPFFQLTIITLPNINISKCRLWKDLHANFLIYYALNIGKIDQKKNLEHMINFFEIK